MTTKTEYAATLQILRNIRAAVTRAGYCGEVAAVVDLDPDFAGRCFLSLHQAGYVAVYDAGRSGRRVRMTAAGERYSSSLGI